MKKIEKSILMQVLCVLIYVFSQNTFLRFISLSLSVWLFSLFINRERLQGIGYILVLFAYISTFFFTPVAQSVAYHYNLNQNILFGLNIFLVFFGTVWIWTLESILNKKIIQAKATIRLNPAGVDIVFVLFISIILGLIYQPSLEIDLSYLGDEHYHAISIEMCQMLLLKLISSPFLFIIWLVVFIWAVVSRFNQSGQGITQIASALLFFLTLIFIRLVYFENVSDPLIFERALRYQCFQPWCSAILNSLCYEFWGMQKQLSFGCLRLLPMLSVFVFAIVLFFSAVKKVENRLLALLISIAVCTSPIMIYQAPLIYLEMPIVAVLTIILIHSKRFLSACSPESLCKSPALWGTIILCFLKETGIFLALLICLLRIIIRFTRNHNKRVSAIFLISNELKILTIVLLPGIIYLAFRYLCGYRPYQLHIGNLIDFNLWGEALSQFLIQYGLIILPAGVGLWSLYNKKRYLFTFCLMMFIGLWFYHYLESPEWIGLARFNLLFMPVIGVLTIEGFQFLKTIPTKRPANHWIYILTIILFAGNAILSPVDLNGRRSDWGKSGERWYEWTKCLLEIKRENPDVNILIGNMPHPYGIGLVLERIDWEKRIRQLPPFVSNEYANLLQTLEYARKENFDCVIFRYENPTIRLNFKQGKEIEGFKLFNEYPARAGGLIVFKKS